MMNPFHVFKFLLTVLYTWASFVFISIRLQNLNQLFKAIFLS